MGCCFPRSVGGVALFLSLVIGAAFFFFLKFKFALLPLSGAAFLPLPLWAVLLWWSHVPFVVWCCYPPLVSVVLLSPSHLWVCCFSAVLPSCSSLGWCCRSHIFSDVNFLFHPTPPHPSSPRLLPSSLPHTHNIKSN